MPCRYRNIVCPRVYRVAVQQSLWGGSGCQQAANASKRALSHVKLKYSWYKVADRMIMYANFRIKNESKQNLKDFVITCQHFAHSGIPTDNLGHLRRKE